MADETQLLWIVFLGIGAAVLGVVDPAPRAPA